MISCLALSHQAVVLNRISYSTNKIFKIRRYLDQICRRTKAPQSAQPESNRLRLNRQEMAVVVDKVVRG